MNKTLLPEGVRVSYGAAFKLNAWAAVAILVSAFGHWFLRKPNLDALLRATISLAPLVPSFLYVRTIARWMRALDELQRRIQNEAWFFAATGTIFIMTALNLLAGCGLLQGGRLGGGLGWEGIYALTFFLWALGCVIANRRYQ
jgi:hypothetical protein